jgi:hypothetical protein
MMDSMTVDAEARPFRVDYGGPHKRIRSDGVPMPDRVLNQPVAAGTLGVLGVKAAQRKAAVAVSPRRQPDEL